MKILVVGLGAIGRRHLANLLGLESVTEVVVLRRQGSSCEPIPGVSIVVDSVEKALAEAPTAAIVCSPAAQHAEISLELANSGVALLVEKPLASTPDHAQAIVQACRRVGVPLMVGYNFRHYPPLMAMHDELSSSAIGTMLHLDATVGQYLPDWRPGSDYRRSASARKILGGGALLELSHELDLALWFGGAVSSVTASTARLSALDLDVEDTAEVLLRYATGAMARIHLDMISRNRRRELTIIGSDGTLTWTWENHTVRRYRPEDGWVTVHESQGFDSNLMYVEELSHFLHCVRTGIAPEPDGSAGCQVVKVVDAARRAAQEYRTVFV